MNYANIILNEIVRPAHILSYAFFIVELFYAILYTLKYDNMYMLYYLIVHVYYLHAFCCSRNINDAIEVFEQVLPSQQHLLLASAHRIKGMSMNIEPIH